jgi:hypothetical protein
MYWAGLQFVFDRSTAVEYVFRECKLDSFRTHIRPKERGVGTANPCLSQRSRLRK